MPKRARPDECPEYAIILHLRDVLDSLHYPTSKCMLCGAVVFSEAITNSACCGQPICDECLGDGFTCVCEVVSDQEESGDDASDTPANPTVAAETADASSKSVGC